MQYTSVALCVKDVISCINELRRSRTPKLPTVIQVQKDGQAVSYRPLFVKITEGLDHRGSENVEIDLVNGEYTMADHQALFDNPVPPSAPHRPVPASSSSSSSSSATPTGTGLTWRPARLFGSARRPI